MKKRIESGLLQSGGSLVIRCVSEKSSWKRGLRDYSQSVRTWYEWIQVSEKSSWKRGLRVQRRENSSGWCLLTRFREKLMKKRIESRWGSALQRWRDIRLFQRKAHEKEDWEIINFLTEYWHSNFIVFQRKAHEKEDWESILGAIFMYGFMNVSEKSSWKRGLRGCLQYSWVPFYHFLYRFREKLMKKRIER